MREPASSSVAGPFLAIAAALATAAATTRPWVVATTPVTIGDVVVDETTSSAGTEFAPLALVAALAGLLLAVGLLATRGAARRTVALLLSVVGVGAVIAIGAGIARVTAGSPPATATPWLALIAATALLASGLWTFGRPGRRLAGRYDVGGAVGDDEWQMAADVVADDDARAPGDAPGDAPGGAPESPR